MWFTRNNQADDEPAKRVGFLRRHLGRYRDVAVGDTVKEQRRTVSWIGQLVRDLNDQPSTAAGDASTATPDTWDEAALHYAYHVDQLRTNYAHWARLAKALLGASVASVVILLHRAVVGDVAGVLASTAALLILVGLALKPAHRCWQIRARTLGQPNTFLRSPSDWWPVDLPADYRPYRSRLRP